MPVNPGPMGGFGNMGRQPNGGGQDIAPPFSAGGDASFDMQDDFQADIPGSEEGSMASMGGDWSQDLGSYNQGSLVPDQTAQANVPIAKRSKGKVLPVVAIGWGVFALLLAILGALLLLSPRTAVSLIPGAGKLYSLMGSPVNLTGLDIQDVRFAWMEQSQGPVLRVEGNVVNVSDAEITPPPVIVSLRDANGSEVTAVTTEVAPLAPGTTAPFVAEIPSPQGVTDLQVRFGAKS